MTYPVAVLGTCIGYFPHIVPVRSEVNNRWSGMRGARLADDRCDSVTSVSERSTILLWRTLTF
jgi:hypothetical protein